MGLRGAHYDIVGVTIGRIGPVRNVIHIELEEGVTALYGVNGVGKTRVMSLLRHALTGTSPEPERPDYSVTSFLDVHVRWHDPRPELGEAVETWDGHGSDREFWLPAAVEAAEAGTTTLRAIGDRGEPRWREYLACSPAGQVGGEALAAADGFWHAKRVEGRPWSELGQQVPPFQVPYWGDDGHPRWARDLPRQVHVPILPVAEVAGARWFEEVREQRGTTTPVRDFHSGLRLADVVTNLDQPFDPDRHTLNALLTATEGVGWGFFEDSPESGTELNEDIAELLEHIETRANELAQHVLIDPPRLEFDLMRPEDWIRGRAPRWRADGYDFGHLSRAQQHWVAISTQLAQAQGPVVFLCDEPELGLHRAAEQRLATGLHAMAALTGAATIVSTHSPGLIGSPLVTPVHVTKDEVRGVSLRPLSLSLVDGRAMRTAAQDLGLTVGDLLAMAKLTVVVEGVHDEWVLQYLLRDSIDAAPAGILPMHGGTRLRSLAEARLVIDATDSEVLVVLDDLVADEASAVFEQVKSAHAAGDGRALREALEDLRQRGRTNDSYLFVHQFALRAAELDRLDRIHLHGLSRPDVICYLDPDTLFPERVDWTDLIEEWTADAAPSQPKNIKGWLRRKGLLPQQPDEVDEAVERAVLQMREEGRPLHEDLVALALRMGRLAQNGSSPGSR